MPTFIPLEDEPEVLEPELVELAPHAVALIARAAAMPAAAIVVVTRRTRGTPSSR
ncbi:hypothetical protein GCM10009753_08990 [Streptantibioticus ferralitis]